MMMNARNASHLMRKLTGLFALMLTLAAIPEPGAAMPSAADTVRHFYAELETTMRNGPRLGDRGRFGALAPVIRDSFDVPYMTRVAVGPAWGSLGADQREAVTDAFARYVIATYADRFDTYSGEQFKITGEHPYGAGILVDTQIVKSDGVPVTVNYLMHRSDDAWRIDDVYLTGTISELATRRSEFSSVLRRQGISGLIDVLNRKADRFLASTAKP